MNILITGGAGFIGSHFVLRHAERFPDDRIVVLDKLTYAADKTYLDPVMATILFIEGDIADRVLVEGIVTDHAIDTIVNFAAESHVDNSILDSDPFLHTNVIGTARLLDVLCAHPEIRMLHVSTDEVFGDLDDHERPRAPGDSLRPSSPYAASKAAAEMLVMAAARTYGLKLMISRCTNNFGPHQADEKFIPTVIRSALADQPVPIYAQGKNKRDWLYVTDHTDAIELMLARGSFDACDVFHVSAESERENIAVARQIVRLLGKPESLLSFVTDRPGHDWRYALDCSSVRALGWAPAVSFDEGLARTVAWYTEKYSP